MARRELLKVTVGAGAASLLFSADAQSDDSQGDHPFSVVDSNINLFKWPFRSLPLDDVGKMVRKLRRLGIASAWAGSFEGLFHRDIAAVNERLFEACEKVPELNPVGSVNPTLPSWEDDLSKCQSLHKMRGIRLHPNYQGYSLDDPRFGSLMELASATGLFVQIAVSMEDTRTQHSSMQVADVDVAPLPRMLQKVPEVAVQLLNHKLRSGVLQQLGDCPKVFFDTARVEGTDGIPNLVAGLPPGRVLFGSHAPFLIPESALIRVHESGRLDDAELRSVLSANATRAFARNA